jgi:hypothetical protein
MAKRNRFYSAPGHAILEAVIRRTSVLVLAAAVSILAAQPMPARAQRASEACVIVWQSESRVKKPAEVRKIEVARSHNCSARCAEPLSPDAQLLPSNLHPRAPPIVL